MEYAIREAEDHDIELLTSLIRNAFRDAADRFNLTTENSPTHPSNCTTDWVRTSFVKGVSYFILETPGGACGCVALERADADVCYLERLAVLPSFRGNGFGRALVDHAADKAKELGAKNIDIGIVSDQRELRDWYERLGFSIKKRPRFEHLPFEVTFMSKAI